MKEFSTTVNQIYRDALAEFGADGAQMREVFATVRPRIRALVESGALTIDVDGAIDAELLAVDMANGKQADRVLAQLAGGQEQFSFDSDPMLDVVVTLGKGLRKQWRDITAVDLRVMDELRYENVRKQQDAYGQWRVSYSPVLSVLDRFSTVGDAIAAGAFGERVAA